MYQFLCCALMQELWLPIPYSFWFHLFLGMKIIEIFFRCSYKNKNYVVFHVQSGRHHAFKTVKHVYKIEKNNKYRVKTVFNIYFTAY